MVVDVLVILFVVILFLAAFMLIRTTRIIKPLPPVESADLPEIDELSVAEHLAETLRVETFTQDPKIFSELHKILEKNYPLVHQQLKKEVISEASLLYTWQGSNEDLKPVLFAAHQDVVPADPETLEKWTYPPFSGEIADGFIWGRGSIDIKSQMVALLEAAEYLIANGFKPQRTIYLAFGQDEEIGGKKGAAKIVEHLQSQGVHLEAMLDEGGTIVNGTVPSVQGAVALIGTAEKGHLSLKIRAEGQPGHSSMPGKESAIGRLSKALTRLENNQMPIRLSAIQKLFQGLGPAPSFGMQFVFANIWFFKPIARQQLEASPLTNALIRTTTALTITKAGVKENVLPQSAEAVVNFRLLPGDTIADVCDHVRKVIPDRQVSFEPIEDGHWEASPVSPTDQQVYLSLKETIRQVFDGIVVAPYLVMGATDARYYAPISDAAYRFSPFVLNAEDMNRMHGIDERISIEGMAKMVAFFIKLMPKWSIHRE